MATPLDNLMAVQQLFGAPAAQFSQQNDQRTNLMLRLATMQREEQLKRDLANLQLDREDARQTAMDRRQTNQLEAMQTREDTRAAATEARQTKTLEEAQRKQTADFDAREARALQGEFAKWYPQYAAAAARAGKTVRQLTEYEKTAEGLGQLQADLREAEIGYETRRFEGAAEASLAELEDAKTALAGAKSRLTELAEPSKEDQKFARQRAAVALKSAIDRGDLPSTAKLKPDAISKGLTALQKGDEEIAATLLGEEAIAAYQGAIDQTLMAMPNTKSRLQERAQAQQQLLQLQQQTARIESDLRKAAATNPILGERLKSSRTPLQELMAPETPKKGRSLEQIFGPPQASTESPARPAPRNAMAMPDLAAGDIGGLANLFSMPATPVPSPAAAPSDEDRVPFSLAQSIRSGIGLPPLTREGYANDIAQLNRLLPYQNERGQAITLNQLQQLLLRAQNDPILAPQP